MKNLFRLSVIALFLTMFSCQSTDPVDFKVGDQCELCKMGIEEIGYATELVTAKGRDYKFDDLTCMQKYITENPDKAENAKIYYVDFKTLEFVEADKATLIQGGNIKSPMNGNYQAYANPSDAEQAANELEASIVK